MNYDQTVNIPIELYESIQGRYFMGYADALSLGGNLGAWARLYNPPGSGVNLHVNVWTVTELSGSPFFARFWFNAAPAETPTVSANVTTTNTALYPAPIPRVELQYASASSQPPSGGVVAFVRNGEPGTTVVETENGKLIFPPGGNFLIYVTLTDTSILSATVRIAFGWWEQRIGCVAL